jgi:hypothetical protein
MDLRAIEFEHLDSPIFLKHNVILFANKNPVKYEK